MRDSDSTRLDSTYPSELLQEFQDEEDGQDDPQPDGKKSALHGLEFSKLNEGARGGVLVCVWEGGGCSHEHITLCPMKRFSSGAIFHENIETVSTSSFCVEI